MTIRYDNYETTAKNIIDRVGKTIILGVPLGIGKPIGLLNAFYRMAAADKSINLTIITGLTLARPLLNNELEKRLVEPILDRLLKDYEDPLYERARQLQKLPDNIKVIEFFLAPGEYLHNDNAQQNYISSKYTSVIRDTIHHCINVFAHQVTKTDNHSNQYSLSCNTDLFLQMASYLREHEALGRKIAVVAEVNCNLPYMTGDAIVKADIFTEIVDANQYHALFALPRDELSIQDHLIGIYTSCLIKDDSCIQIGIGKLSSAIANALILRQNQNSVYRDLLNQLAVIEKFGTCIETAGSTEPFAKGLYTSTEMITDEFIHLYEQGILKKRVYDDIGLQRLLNSNLISEKITPDFLDILLDNNIINSKLTDHDINFLKKFGIFKSTIHYQSGNLLLSSGETIPADLNLPQANQKIIEHCLGDQLKSGKIIHAGFFIGSHWFYEKLRQLSPTELDQIDMTTIARTNSLLWSYELAQLQRQHARFSNSVMMITLGGAFVSDGLKNLQEVSGVGGQFDFVDMAQSLKHGRSIINCRSTRKTKKGLQSNILWDYSNFTIPRYLRDIFITEYGIADTRSKTDAEVIKAILNITDSNFQEELLNKAKKYGKIPKDYEIPRQFRQNYAKNIEPILREFQLKGYCQPYPFGSDLTAEEQTLQNALLFLKICSPTKLILLILKSLFFSSHNNKIDQCLQRMKLDRPSNLKDFIYKKLLSYVIAKQDINP